MAMALRAAGRHSSFGTPLSLSCHFLSAPKLGPIRLEACSLRKARVAESVRVTLQQEDRFIRDFDPQRDAYMDAGRCAVVLDAFTWPAAAHAHAGDSRFVAPTISFSIDFHRRTPSPWLLSDAFSPSADAGRIGIHNRLFSPDGTLIASGNGTLTCRPRPRV